jgi:hypothetical protein
LEGLILPRGLVEPRRWLSVVAAATEGDWLPASASGEARGEILWHSRAAPPEDLPCASSRTGCRPDALWLQS